MIDITCGLILEVLGYVTRIKMRDDPFIDRWFTMYVPRFSYVRYSSSVLEKANPVIRCCFQVYGVSYDCACVYKRRNICQFGTDGWGIFHSRLAH